jgi:hypothetical protein
MSTNCHLKDSNQWKLSFGYASLSPNGQGEDAMRNHKNAFEKIADVSRGLEQNGYCVRLYDPQGVAVASISLRNLVLMSTASALLWGVIYYLALH